MMQTPMIYDPLQFKWYQSDMLLGQAKGKRIVVTLADRGLCRGVPQNEGRRLRGLIAVLYYKDNILFFFARERER